MARKSKYQDIVTIVDGVKITQCAARMPKRVEQTFSVDKSRYTVWTRGVSNYRRGSHGVIGTVDTL